MGAEDLEFEYPVEAKSYQNIFNELTRIRSYMKREHDYANTDYIADCCIRIQIPG